MSLPTEAEATTPRLHPKVTITYCTQCKWMLRAAYHAQELLSTFSTSLAEVALRPGTGGIYTIDLETASQEEAEATPQTVRLWDRKTQGGFPETKVLKRLIRDVIEPGRGLGHVDRGAAGTGTGTVESGKTATVDTVGSGKVESGTTANTTKEDVSGDGSKSQATLTPTSANGFVIVEKDAGSVPESGVVLDSATQGPVDTTTGHAEQAEVDADPLRKDPDDEDQCDCAYPWYSDPNI